ncbi:thiol-disulfide oxidoreductase DCC family protein [Halorhabdus salina]|uniref:thiol-disulfide oxidoreductase DCC family protein n=1 Tax=Halorhabdus salina TaxID=2750670 RepID=UPI0015EE752D|nr:DUF393 domain-containing protein [Halorhabdus salina]
MAPTLVYDDDCGFCTRSARFVARHGRVEIVGFSELSEALRDRLPEDYRECAHLVTDETVYSCGEAVERGLAKTELVPPGFFRAIRAVPGYAWARERGYRWVAKNRATVSRILP